METVTVFSSSLFLYDKKGNVSNVIVSQLSGEMLSKTSFTTLMRTWVWEESQYSSCSDVGEMGTGWIRWDSLLPEQLLHSSVFEEAVLSLRITLMHRREGEGGRERERGKKLFAWSQTVWCQSQELCQCRAKPSLGLKTTNKIKRICQQGVETKSTESKKHCDKEEGAEIRQKKGRFMLNLQPNKIIPRLCCVWAPRWKVTGLFCVVKADRWRR